MDENNNVVSLSSANIRYDPYAFPTASHHDAHPNHPHPYHQNQTNSRPRRRREMQAITKIVETRDYPYIDGHSWRNNGNTVQKKTGNKSVYYKCANSIKVSGSPLSSSSSETNLLLLGLCREQNFDLAWKW
jgi:hypothetical protein